jgi:hypothetical protein
MGFFMLNVSARPQKICDSNLSRATELGDISLGSLGDRRSRFARMFLFEQAQVSHNGLNQKSTAHQISFGCIGCGGCWTLIPFLSTTSSGLLKSDNISYRNLAIALLFSSCEQFDPPSAAQVANSAFRYTRPR